MYYESFMNAKFDLYYGSTCVKLMNLLINHVILNYENDKICNNYIIIQYTITES